MSTPMRQRVSYQALLLGGFTALSAALLVAGNTLTKDAIHQRAQEDLQASFSAVVPSAEYDNRLVENTLQFSAADGTPFTVYRGTRNGQVSVVAWELSGEGYAGPIRLLLGLKADGEVLGVRVLAHNETPGLGDKIEVAKDAWITRFSGLSLGNPPLEQWQVKKDGGQFDSFSGATITPRAVVKAIQDGLVFFSQHREELLKPAATANPPQQETQP